MLAAYILVWPAISAIVLVVIVTAFSREWRAAKRDGRKVV